MAKRKLPTDDAALDWSNEEKLALIEAMKSQCPDLDKLSFTARLGKVNWKEVKVEGRTAEQCQEAWHHISGKVRKFRTLPELMQDAEDMVLHPDRYPSKKKMKHPDQPVRPLTACFQYMKDQRERVKATHPQMTNTELARFLSQQWQALEPTKQNKYIKKYKKRWAKFQKANIKFLEDHPECNSRQPKPWAPTPSGLFIKAKAASLREKHPDMDNLQLANRARVKYTKLTADKKKKWIQKAMDAFPEYEKEIRLYRRIHPDFEPPSKKVRLTRQEAMLNGDIVQPQKKMKFKGAPEKPPRSAFQLFVKKKIGGMEGNLQSKMHTLGQQWKDLGTRQQKYTKKLTRLREKHQLQLQVYKETLTEQELTAFEESLKPARRKKKTGVVEEQKDEEEVDHDSPS